MSEEVGADNLGNVEGIPQRDVAMRFSKHFASYNPGEVAYFLAAEAQELTTRGVAAAYVPSAGLLTGGVPPGGGAALLTALQLVSGGSFAITISSQALEVGLLNFTAAPDLPACGAIITSYLATFGTCTWNGTRFVITTTSTGPSATITYASTATIGTNIAGTLRFTEATGAVLTQGS